MHLKSLIKRDIEITIYESVTSTNAVAKQAAPLLQKDMLIISSHQSEGRGRLGRSFYSPFCSGIYMSLCFQTDLCAQDLTLVTTAAAVAVAQTLEEETDKHFGIKWVNDIYLGNKKVCGILTEGVFDSVTNTPYCAVLGIGINLFAPVGGYPEDIKNIAGAVFDSECNDEIRNRIIAGIINRFYVFYDDITNKPFLLDYRNRSILDGKTVAYYKNGIKYQGTVKGVNENLNLVICSDDGKIQELCTGEVSFNQSN